MAFKWHYITWIFFHTICEKIKPEFFISAKSMLINTIRNICDTLPCPICSNHARSLLSRVNFDDIITKDQFKHFMFAFHNRVNKDIGKKIEPLSVLEKYKGVSMHHVTHYLVQSYSIQNYTSVMHSARANYRNQPMKFQVWYLKNSYMFE